MTAPAPTAEQLLEQPCPKCVAGAGEPCCKPNGDELGKPHAARVKATAAALEAARRRADGDASERIATPRFRRVYAAARLELENRGDWTRLAAEQLESLTLNMELAEAARTKAKMTPLVSGSMGQDVVNPLAALALRLDAQALASARALKLTPDTRGARAPAVDDDDVGDPKDETPADGLSELDELAARRKAAAAGGKGRRRRR